MHHLFYSNCSALHIFAVANKSCYAYEISLVVTWSLNPELKRPRHSNMQGFAATYHKLGKSRLICRIIPPSLLHAWSPGPWWRRTLSRIFLPLPGLMQDQFIAELCCFLHGLDLLPAYPSLMGRRGEHTLFTRVTNQDWSTKWILASREKKRSQKLKKGMIDQFKHPTLEF